MTNQPRTVLEQKIRERQQTYEEFAEYAEKFARDHREPGTISVRHLQRLAAGQRGTGRALGPVRPATARLLERIFGVGIAELLAPPTDEPAPEQSELQRRLTEARRVDTATLDLMAGQLDALRQLDRRLGAAATLREAVARIDQLTQLMAHSLTPATRTRLAELLSDVSSLAGWAALDLGDLDAAWTHHEHAKAAAREADSIALMAHAAAQQAVVLLDLGEPEAAARQAGSAASAAGTTAPPILRSWLAAAHGQCLAAAGHSSKAHRAYEVATTHLMKASCDPAYPYVLLDRDHLDRWRGHALTLLADSAAVAVLADVLYRLDGDFIRAAAAARTDLADALTATGRPDEARLHLRQARHAATEIGSIRLRSRVHSLVLRIGAKS